MKLIDYEEMKNYLFKGEYTYMSTYNKATNRKELSIKTEDNAKVLCMEYDKYGRFIHMYITNAGENAMETLVESCINAAFVAQQFEHISYHDNVNVFKISR